MEKHRTDCCALMQLSRVDNNTSLGALQRAIVKLTAEKLANTEVGITTGNGQTAIFTIVSPGEDILAKNLETVGFKPVHTFERRVGYPKMGDLTMYIKNL
jgi:hypothetical protein